MLELCKIKIYEEQDLPMIGTIKRRKICLRSLGLSGLGMTTRKLSKEQNKKN